MLKIGVYRSPNKKWITGVCAGFAQYLNVNPLWVRLAVLAIAILPAGIGIIPIAILYIALTILLPEGPDDTFPSTF